MSEFKKEMNKSFRDGINGLIDDPFCNKYFTFPNSDIGKSIIDTIDKLRQFEREQKFKDLLDGHI